MRTDVSFVRSYSIERAASAYLSSNWDVMTRGDACLVYDTRLQILGADISCRNGLLIDAKVKNEKSVNRIFDYPSVEISIHDNGRPGWFVDPRSVTHAYMFVSLFSDAGQVRSADDITGMHCMLFSRKALREFVERTVSVGRIREDAATMNERNDRIDYTSGGRKAFHLRYSSGLRERPVNLVLRLDDYRRLPGTREFWIGGRGAETGNVFADAACEAGGKRRGTASSGRDRSI